MMSVLGGRRVARRFGAVAAAVALLLGVPQLSAAPGAAGSAALADTPRDPYVKVDPQKYPLTPSMTAAPVSVRETTLPEFVSSAAAVTAVKTTVSLGAGGLATAGSTEGLAAGRSVSQWVPVGGDGVEVAVTGSAAVAKSAAKPVSVAVSVTPPAADKGLSIGIAAPDGAAPVAVRVPDRLLRDAFGGNYAARVRWVSPEGTSVTVRQADGATVLSLTAGATTSSVVALSGATASDGTGSYAATPLSASKTWAVSTQTGAFTYDYPFSTVPVGGGLVPSVALAYNSGAIDGRTGDTNNQSGLIGEGWDLTGLGYIERSYIGCAVDGQPASGDLCWKSDNASLSMGGRAGKLVKDSSGLWHVQADDGSRIERLTGADNGAKDGEYWKVTTTDGTQYFFGLNKLPGWTTGKPVTDSTWTVPVFGNDSGEPCHAGSFATSSCAQAWRWNLDYVVDVHGNSYSISYAKQLNYYLVNGSTATQYVMGGYPKWVDYGTRGGSVLTAAAPARLSFASGNRCLTSPCDQAHPANWLDTPWDQYCPTSACVGKVSPTFWNSVWITEVHNQVLSGGAYVDVDKWVLGHQFPDPGDGTSPAAWLTGVTKTSGTVTFPVVNFNGVAMQNRVDPVDGLAKLDKFRIIGVRLETGGSIAVGYTAQECNSNNLPAAAESNTKRCFPQWWQPTSPAGQPPKLDYFHKYLVSQVAADPKVGGGEPDTTTYTYLDSPGWRYDTNPMVDPDKRTWSDFAGYGQVKASHGNPDAGAALSRETTVTTYFKGMDGDRLNPAGGTKSVSVAATDSTTVTDSLWWAGQVREQRIFNGDGGAQVATTITTPWASTPTATDGSDTARYTGTATAKTITAITASPGTRTTQTNNTYDTRGRVTATDDLGNTATAADDRCARTTFADNPTAGLWAFPAEQKVTAGACATTPTLPADAISDSRTFYDGTTTVGAAPTRGLVTRVDAVTGYTGSTPTWQTQQTATYDALGRQLSVTDPRLTTARTSTLAYTPAGAGLPTQTVATNPLGWTTTTTIDPKRGAPTAVVDANGKRTDLSYDTAGRLTAVWLTDRSKTTYPSAPSVSYAYTVSKTAASTITTTALVAGHTNTAVQLFDGLARPRQTQSPDPEGLLASRVVTDTFYDEAGRVSATNGAWPTEGAPATTLVVPTGTLPMPRATKTLYDGAGRVTAEVTIGNDVELWRTSYTHSGDYTTVTPPAGATRTAQTVDARGNITKIGLFHSTTTASGASDDTSYTYTPAGQLKSMTDAAGNTWTWTYDVLGRQTAAHDPDAGDTAQTFDAAGRVATTTDGRGQVVAYKYDNLDRKVETWAGSLTGTKLAAWTWDTLAKGQLTQSARYYGSNTFVTAVTGYDDGYRPTGSKIVIPTVMGNLAGTYTTNQTYLAGGLPAITQYPAVGGLPAENVQKSYTYNLGLPGGVGSNLGAYTTAATYTQFGELSQITSMYGGSQIVHSFTRQESTGRVTNNLQQRFTSTDSTIANHTYTYNNAGDTLTDTNVVPAAGNETRCYTYDYQQRLTQAWTGANAAACGSAPSTATLAGPAKFWQTYSYDTAGNRTQLVEHATTSGGSNATRGYTYNTPGGAHPNVLTVATKSGSPVITSTYSHDNAGNLTGTASGATTTGWGYDELGKLATQTTNGVLKQTRYYSADGDLLATLAAAGDSYLYLPETVVHRNASNVLDARRTYANGFVVAERASTPGTTTTTVTHPMTDPNGSITARVTANSSMTVTRLYSDPYGRLLSPTTSWGSPNGFLNKPNDPTTGYTHLGARDYNPLHGRFTTVDPILTPYQPKQNNGYTYAWNNPITNTDPEGLAVGGAQIVDDGFQLKALGSQASVNHYNSMRAAQYAQWQVDQKPIQPINYAGYYVGEPLPGSTYAEQDAVDKLNCLGRYHNAGCYAEAVANVVGFDDAKNCVTTGSAGSCILTALSVIPIGKIVKVGTNAVKGIKAAEEIGAATKTAAQMCSFEGSTLVLMADGTKKPIEDIKIGDHVMATDPESGEDISEPVEHVFVHEDFVIDLVVGNEVITTTEDHPFWSATDQRFERVDELSNGEKLLSTGGELLIVSEVRAGVSREALAYNISVGTIHTYHVGAAAALVHNTCLSALKDWTSKRFQFGNAPFLLDKSDMTHILERHHPTYWDGSIKDKQSFFDDSMSIADVEDAIGAVARQNREELIGIGTGYAQVQGSVNGVSYVLGVSRGHVRQFYPGALR